MFGVGVGVLDIIGDIDMGVSRDELDIGISLDDTAGLDSAGIMITSDNNNDWGEMKAVDEGAAIWADNKACIELIRECCGVPEKNYLCIKCTR